MLYRLHRNHFETSSIPFRDPQSWRNILYSVILMKQSFDNFSFDIALGRIKELAPPFDSYLSYDGDIIDYCHSFFQIYNRHLLALKKEEIYSVGEEMSEIALQYSGKQASFDLFKDVDTVQRMIFEALVQSFKGFPSEAFRVFEERMLADNMHLFELFPQIEIRSIPLFRVRKDSGEVVNSSKDLFHVPFEKRIRCGTDRFSILGYPSLYLSTKLEIAKRETEIADEKYYAACFKPTRPLHFLDLSLNNTFESIWERYCLLVFYPLMMACGLTVKSPSYSFKPEYIIPQTITQVFRLHMLNSSFDGISYISTTVDEPNYMDMNMRNYVLWIQGADQREGTSKSLAESFSVSGPIKCSSFKSTQEIENELKQMDFSPVQI